MYGMSQNEIPIYTWIFNKLLNIYFFMYDSSKFADGADIKRDEFGRIRCVNCYGHYQ